jgi:DNA repair exonuclease SbcCD ATPase subunit
MKKRNYRFTPEKVEELDRRGGQAWADLMKSPKDTREEQERELAAYKESLALESASKRELEEIRKKTAAIEAESNERIASIRENFEKEKRSESADRFLGLEAKIEELRNIVRDEAQAPEEVEERDQRIEVLEDCFNEMADVLELVIEAVRAIGGAITAPKVRKIIRDSKGDITETVETIVDDGAKDEQ